MLENELYEPMRCWLEQYLKDYYKGYDIITVDTSQERLDRALKRYDIVNEMATGVDIQIDVLGIARKKNIVKLFFIEAKKTKLTLRDLGQLWAYCKLVDPEEAFLFSSAGLGSLNKLINSFRREDLLDFGNGKKIKKIFGNKIRGIEYYDVVEEAGHWSFKIGFFAYDYFYVVFTYELDIIGFSIEIGNGRLVSIMNTHNCYSNTDMEAYIQRIVEELELRIPDKYLQTRGWL